MIKLKDLKNRVYLEKKCISFDYDVLNEEGEFCFEVRFKKLVEKLWQMKIVLEGNGESESQVYTFLVSIPKENMPLELIAATGLRYFQMHIKDEIQRKVEFDFAIGEVVKGM